MTATADGLEAPLSAEYPERSEPWPFFWVTSASVSLLALVAWQRSPGWAWVAMGALTTAAAAMGVRQTRRPRWWAGGASAMLAFAVVLAAADTMTLRKIASDWAQWSDQEREGRAESVATSVSDVAGKLNEAATRIAGDTALLARVAAPSPIGGIRDVAATR